MKINSIDVLNLEWTSYPSRDRQMATLVSNYLRFMGYEVIEVSVFNGFHLMNKYSPTIFLISGAHGADINFDLMKYAVVKKGIIGVSLISEGNFREGKNEIDGFLWGWNCDKVLYETVHMQWTDKTRKLTLKYFPSLAGKIKVSGGVGFDVYKIAKKTNRKKFLKKYTKNSFSKVIGIGCWSFGFLYDPKNILYSYWLEICGKEGLERFKKDRDLFNRIILDVVSQNPDILFLLKEHPGELYGKFGSGIEGTEKFSNVLILKNEESIIDCIQVSDFWITYESTTVIEAWLSGKETCLINPTGTDFIRANVHYGSPNYPTAKDMQNAIEYFYKNRRLSGFAELEQERKKVIQETIQWDDGLNHVRAGNEIIDILEKNKGTQKIKKNTFKESLKYLKQRILWDFYFLLYPFSRYKDFINKRKSFNLKELKEFQEKRLEEQIEFYKKNGLDKQKLRSIRCL